MGDLNDQTQNVNIWNDEKSKSVTVTTDNGKERLDVSPGATDETTGNQIIISHAHHEIHEGDHFDADTFADLQATGEHDVLIQVGSLKELHMLWAITTALKTGVTLYESPTWSVAGTPVPAINAKFSSAITSDATITHSPTISAVGTKKQHQYAVGGRAAGGGGGSARSDNELIFKTDTDYLIRIDSHENSNHINIILSWYEEDDTDV